ncbi:12650_t:CDS:1, partial [Dentiscutata heterogama]
LSQDFIWIQRANSILSAIVLAGQLYAYLQEQAWLTGLFKLHKNLMVLEKRLSFYFGRDLSIFLLLETQRFFS